MIIQDYSGLVFGDNYSLSKKSNPSRQENSLVSKNIIFQNVADEKGR